MYEIVEFGGNDYPMGTMFGIKMVYPFVMFGTIEVPLLNVTIT